VNIAFFDNSINQAHRVSIQEFDIANPTKMISRIDAVKCTYDTTSRNWIVENVLKRFFSSEENRLPISADDINRFKFHPDDLASKQQSRRNEFR